MLKDCTVAVTGGNGFLGQFVTKKLWEYGFQERNVFSLSSRDYDLRDQLQVRQMYADINPNIVIHLAANFGGIGANLARPGDIIYDNLIMGANIVHIAIEQKRLPKIVFTGSVCSFPKVIPTPFKMNDFWSGYPEESNAPYGIAKKAIGLLLECYNKQYGLDYSYLILSNLMGPFDHFEDIKTNHVIPALIRKIDDAQRNKQNSIKCWGSGMATREFLYVEDAADAIVKSCLVKDTNPLVIGSGEEIRIKDLVKMIATAMEFRGNIEWDASMPDGQPKRLVDSSYARKVLDWKPKYNLFDGLNKTISWYLDNKFIYSR